jgi:catechol 2,3-dioxygenase-like lactoylglutathione lyase family enzyme
VSPRVRRILETALDCDDLARTAAFYRALLDTGPILDTERLVVFDSGDGTLLLLFQRGNTEALPTSGGLIPGHDAGGPGHFASTKRISPRGNRDSRS